MHGVGDRVGEKKWLATGMLFRNKRVRLLASLPRFAPLLDCSLLGKERDYKASVPGRLLSGKDPRPLVIYGWVILDNCKVLCSKQSPMKPDTTNKCQCLGIGFWQECLGESIHSFHISLKTSKDAVLCRARSSIITHGGCSSV